MTVALITLSKQGERVAQRIASEFPECQIHAHASVAASPESARFHSVAELSTELFDRYRKLVYIAPCGVVVRSIAPLLKHKTSDPAVVVVDVGGRYAISLLSGHEGGANDLALDVANVIGAEPVISTTSEAAKNLIIGIGCRRGAPSALIASAIQQALAEINASLEQVRLLASARIKQHEPGLLEAARELRLSIRFIPHDEIVSTKKSFHRSQFVKEKIKLPAVAEPSALLAGRRTQLLLPKTIFNGVTVAIAQENSL